MDISVEAKARRQEVLYLHGECNRIERKMTRVKITMRTLLVCGLILTAVVYLIHINH